MKISQIVSALTLLFLTVSAFLFTLGKITVTTDADPVTINVMSYNIRFDNPNDGDSRWEFRKEQVVDLIRFHNTDFVGTQEGLVNQLEYIDEQIPEMSWIGVGRDDGADAGEFSAIFYNNERFELIEGTDQTIWLSETPDIPEPGWDAALPRVVTFGKFRQVWDGKEFYLFNTHFDHRGIEARKESSIMILETIRDVTGDSPVILAGDFNVTPDSEPYAILTSGTSPLRDAYHISQLPHVGPEFTFGGFMVCDATNERRIDYILVNDSIVVHKHAILPYFRNGRYPSDHLPVIAELEIR